MSWFPCITNILVSLTYLILLGAGTEINVLVALYNKYIDKFVILACLILLVAGRNKCSGITYIGKFIVLACLIFRGDYCKPNNYCDTITIAEIIPIAILLLLQGVIAMYWDNYWRQLFFLSRNPAILH